MIFTKFKSLTSDIEKTIIQDLKRVMPFKYWLFKASELAARVGILGFIVTFATYIILGTAIQRSGSALPEAMVENFAVAIIILLSLFIIGTIIRGGLFSDLQKRVSEKWHGYNA
ncbi:hypothetical protein QDE92_004700 [Salmonella enterica]|nr:hypothetical protein [Salmonella enterica]